MPVVRLETEEKACPACGSTSFCGEFDGEVTACRHCGTAVPVVNVLARARLILPGPQQCSACGSRDVQVSAAKLKVCHTCGHLV